MRVPEFGERLRRARLALPGKVSQTTLADGVGVSFKTISAWERGSLPADVETLYKLAGCLKVPAAVLLLGQRGLEDLAAHRRQGRCTSATPRVQTLGKNNSGVPGTL